MIPITDKRHFSSRKVPFSFFHLQTKPGCPQYDGNAKPDYNVGFSEAVLFARVHFFTF